MQKIVLINIKLKNCLPYENNNAIFELFEQFASECLYKFSTKCWQFWDSAQNMLNFWCGVQEVYLWTSDNQDADFATHVSSTSP